jgi:hypothetical protein
MVPAEGRGPLEEKLKHWKAEKQKCLEAGRMEADTLEGLSGKQLSFT